MASLLGCLMPDQVVWVQAIEQDNAVVHLDKILYSLIPSLMGHLARIQTLP